MFLKLREYWNWKGPFNVEEKLQKKLLNNMIFLFLLISAGILTLLTYNHRYPYTIPLVYLVWLIPIYDMFNSIIYIDKYRRSRKYRYRLFNNGNNSNKNKKYRIATFVVSYNENPEMVKGTLISVLTAARSYGSCDVFLLDDSTDENIVAELKSFCEENGITYLHRLSRRGFKAGAINDALAKYAKYYDLVAIFDADQRPKPEFFHVVTPYFSDPSIAFVQVPQNYTETYTKIAEGAKYQQIPFLRVIMRGRNLVSAMSLGSGTIFRISALEKIKKIKGDRVEYLREDVITEDAATSLELFAKGFKSIYIDTDLIWYGEPPQDLHAYLAQQGRWSFGYFQLSKDLLRLDLPLITFLDYLAGLIY